MDEGFHGRMPESVEAKEIHFFQGFFRGPFIKGHTVRSDKHTRAIIAKAAMHKYFLLRIIAEEREKLRDLIVARRRPATHGNVNETYSERVGLLALPGNFPGVFAAKIDDGSDAQFLQFWKAFLERLRAAIERIANLAGIRKSLEVQFLAES